MTLVVTFHSVSDALLLEQTMKNRGDRCKVIPVPRALSSSCGYAAETDCAAELLFAVLAEHEIEYEGVYVQGEAGWTDLG